jgi:RNA polymerase sigma-70 factor (ECF subfamily)
MSAAEQTPSDVLARNGWFQTTRWTMVLAAGQGGTPQAAAALSTLCQTYWYALYTYIRRSGYGPEDAKDLTQGFFGRLVEKDYLKSVIPGRAKFRSFLLVALKRYLANEWHRANRVKRGGGQEFISLDEVDTENRYLAEPVDDKSPEKAFDRRWALMLLDRVMQRLEREASQAGKSQWFAQLRVFLSGEEGANPYPELAQRLGLKEGAARVAVHRLRQKYREALRLEIADTVQTPQEIDEEIQDLFAALA